MLRVVSGEKIEATPGNERRPVKISIFLDSSGKLVPGVCAGQSVHGFDGLNGFSPIGYC